MLTLTQPVALGLTRGLKLVHICNHLQCQVAYDEPACFP